MCSFDWKNATNIELNNYKLILDELLKDIYLPYDVINCKKFFCNEHTSFITENLDSIIDIIVLSASLTIPRVKKFNNKKRLTGINMLNTLRIDRSFGIDCGFKLDALKLVIFFQLE